MAKSSSKPAVSNAFVDQALERWRAIEREAEEKKHNELKNLHAAMGKIDERIAELVAQKKLITDAIGQVGSPRRVMKTQGRGDHSEVRARIARWFPGHKGEKFGAKALIKEFPELAGVSISIVMNPMVKAGTVKKEGAKGNTVYFV